MPNAEPHRLFATDILRLIEGGGLTAEAVVASCLERIAEREPVVRAWAYLAAEKALERARAFDKAGRRPCSAVCRLASKTSSILPACRRPTARRSIPDGGRRAMRVVRHCPQRRAASCSAKR